MATVRLHVTPLHQHVSTRKCCVNFRNFRVDFSDTRHCLRYIAFYGRETYFAFIGDSKIKELYLGFISHLQQNDGNLSVSSLLQSESNHLYSDGKLKIKVEFIWSANVSVRMVEEFKKWERADAPPAVVIAGSGLWAIKAANGSAAVLDEYRVNLTRLVQPIDGLHKRKSEVLWALLAPVNPDRLKVEFQMISNTQIDLYNKAAIEVGFCDFKSW